MNDWYNKGWNRLVVDISKQTGLSNNDVVNVYNALSCAGLIDYDVEKEVFHRIMFGELE